MTPALPRLQPSASYSVTIRTENPHTPGMVGRIGSAIGEAGGLIGAIDVIEVNKDRTVRDFVVAAADASEEQSIVACVRSLPGVRVIDVADRFSCTAAAKSRSPAAAASGPPKT